MTSPTSPRAEPNSVPDITEPDALPRFPSRRRMVGPAGLYARWESQQWSVAAVEPARDRARWNAVNPAMRGQLLRALAELEVGEESVTKTLGALLDHAPTADDRIYLCTQMADEARHVRFFNTYLNDVCAADAAKQRLRESGADVDYGRLFAPILAEATGRARDEGSKEAWLRAVVVYHLLSEGVLGAAVLRSARQFAKRLKLTALVEGLTNVVRDESRHVSFGLHATAEGVQNGCGDVIWEAHLEAIEMTAHVLIGPGNHIEGTTVKVLLEAQARKLQDIIDIGRERLVRQLRSIGLGSMANEAESLWDRAIATGLVAYGERWQEPHPISVWKRNMATS